MEFLTHPLTGRSSWTYKLMDGRCTTSLALETARVFGIDEEVVRRAEELGEDFDRYCRGSGGEHRPGLESLQGLGAGPAPVPGGKDDIFVDEDRLSSSSDTRGQDLYLQSESHPSIDTQSSTTSSPSPGARLGARPGPSPGPSLEDIEPWVMAVASTVDPTRPLQPTSSTPPDDTHTGTGTSTNTDIDTDTYQRLTQSLTQC